MPDQPELSQELAQKLDALVDRIAGEHEFSEDRRRELRAHLEDKAISYLSGEQRLGDADVLLLVEKHFGDSYRLRRWALAFCFGTTAYFIGFLLFVCCTWVAAWISLGHPPRPSLDDPKSINGVVSILALLATLLMVGYFTAFVAAIIFGLGGVFWIRAERGWDWGASLLVAVLPAVTGVVTFVILRADPGHVMSWLGD